MHDAAGAKTTVSEFIRRSFLFPSFLCGPILLSGQTWIREKFLRPQDVWLICTGLIKVLILLPFWNAHFETGLLLPFQPDVSGVMNLLKTGIYRYVQLYLDFSGIIDIAVGVCGLLGMRIRHNFKKPWLASSVGDFWRRWHITLGAWMRRHVYNPLGKTRFALFLVFLLVGAWHGLKFHFFLWGALHGLAITIERLVSSRWNVPEFLARQPIAMRGLRIVLTQLFITLSWVLFFWA